MYFCKRVFVSSCQNAVHIFLRKNFLHVINVKLNWKQKRQLFLKYGKFLYLDWIVFEQIAFSPGAVTT